MKTKRTTKKKPPSTARDLRDRIIALEVNHESLCETLRALQGRVDAMRRPKK